MDDDKLNQMFTSPARKKWRHLRKKGYHGMACRSAGVIFGTSEGGEAGHISWFGRVTWMPDHDSQ